MTNSIGTFAADKSFAGGTPNTGNGAIAGTANGAMYQSERAGGSFGYALPVSNGKYTVVLHFAETYWTAAGQRVFDVAAEGTKVLTRYDIVKKVGPLTATSESFAVTVSDNVLNLDFSALFSAGGVDQAKVSAIEVLPGTACPGTAAPTVAGPLAYCTGATAPALSASVTVAAGATLVLYNAATGGTALAANFAPPTTAVGSITYYAAQVAGGCESARVAIVVNVTNGPAVPSVTSPLAYCLGTPAALLSTSVTLATGATLRLYASATSTEALADFRPATTTIGSTTYYAAQLLNGCESGRAPIAVNVTDGPAAPVTVSSVGYCIGDQAALLSKGVTLAPGATLRLYAAATGGAILADFIPTTTAAGTTTYYATQVVGTCESARTALTVAVSSGPATPGVVSPLTYCQGAAAGLLSASVALAPGSAIRVYAAASGGTALADFSPSTTALGSTTYYVAQVTGSCESGRAPIMVTVVEGTARPVVATPVAYCVGTASALLSASVTLADGAALRLYASATSTVALSDFRPSTTTIGSTTYYAAQLLNGCESGRAPIAVNVTDGPAAPVVRSPVAYCIGTQSALLSANVTLADGATLRLYASATSTAALADFAPSTTSIGSTTYYAAQLLNGCESGRASIVVNVTNGPAVPAVVGSLTYCQGTAAALLSSGVTLIDGATLRLYASATSTEALADFRPATTTIGSTTYYAAQLLNGCESGRAPIVVNVMSELKAPALVPPPGINPTSIAAWGDSFTEANYSLYPQLLAQLTGGTVYKGGIGGQTSVQIKDRLVAAPEMYKWPVIIWAGRNDSNAPAQVKASIATMVATIGHNNYLIISICNGAGEGIGTYGYGLVKPLNDDLAAIYGNHYLDVRAFLVDHYDPTQPQDVADHAADVPPTSLRQDFLHPNRAGSTLIANYIYANLNQLMAANYCQSATARPLSSGVALATGASLRVYSSPTATTATPDFVPSTATSGNTTYYVSQAMSGCESPRTPLTVSVVNCSGDVATRVANSQKALAQPAPAAQPQFEVYPNPFADVANVDFALATTQSYTLELYDAKGMLIQHIAAGTAEAGTKYHYQVSGRDLAEGIYLVRLVAGKNSKIFKLTMAR
ncbi:malectin domain-containing carbohydrate-binding protein [Hymenobacter coccineus]|uniref:SGNH hydrolase-type esterase domain-containing protein n=1 Tax=Hymenobacter coccineus TaxID=1908235 RepID=A0A1G1SQ70_9BACT|nr:malectin domain-containing carbohydrate-binding protein [Hymenobacter coccineus]OGX80767.1 hypothetical protein BEN49_03370 [Hymenobacter coccineus]